MNKIQESLKSFIRFLFRTVRRRICRPEVCLNIQAQSNKKRIEYGIFELNLF
jgi:hypothetical protein